MQDVKDFKIINERICCLRLKAKWFSCTLINVHVLTKRDRKQLNIFESKAYRRILGRVYDNEKQKLEDINQ